MDLGIIITKVEKDLIGLNLTEKILVHVEGKYHIITGS